MLPAQLNDLATYVNGQPTLKQYLIDGRDNLLTAAFNTAASPDWWVWRTSITEEEITTGTSPDNTTFNWSALIARTPGEQFAWGRMFGITGSVNPSQANVRSAFADIFSGTNNSAPAQRAYLQAMGRRLAKLAEKVLSTGTGSSVDPALLTFEGNVSDSDSSAIARILGLR
jgi:hypothetical protein